MNEILKRLGQIDVKKRISEINEELKITNNKSKIDKLISEVKILRMLDEQGISAETAFSKTVVPVIPAQYRSPIELPNGTLQIPSINILLRNVAKSSELLNDAKEYNSPEEIKSYRKSLYKSLSELSGFEAPTRDRQVQTNPWTEIKGTGAPKGGMFQSKILKRRRNLSGRGVIVPDPELNIDELSIPTRSGYSIYQPFIIQKLTGMGYSVNEAKDMIEQNSPIAHKVLVNVGNERGLLMNRAPSIWPTSVTTHRPIFKDQDVIGIPNLSAPMIAGDFDGDCVSLHAPATIGAMADFARMRASQNLIFEPTGELTTVPQHSAIVGLYLMSKTTDGKKVLNDLLPPGYDVKGDMDKKQLSDILRSIVQDQEQKSKVGDIISKLRKVGDNYATEHGHSIGLSDLEPMTSIRNKYLDEINLSVKDARKKKITAKELDKKYEDVAYSMEKDMLNQIKHETSEMKYPLLSGARGSESQYRDLLITPLSVKGANKDMPIEHSYAEGITPREYWQTAIGARIGIRGKSQETSLPGALAKELQNTAAQVVIKGIKSDDMNIKRVHVDNELIDRYLAENVTTPSGKIIANKDELITPAIIQILKKNKIKDVAIYTVLGSSSPDGTLPAMAYGINRDGVMHETGFNIGALSSLAVVEPLFTSSMGSFHTGAALTGKVSGYPRVKQILNIPKIISHKAAIAKLDGKVDKIEKDETLNGHNIIIYGEEHYVWPGNDVYVKEGDTVKKGQILSSGSADLRELYQNTDIDTLQDYMVKALKKEVPKVRERNLEVIVESMTRYGEITDAGDTEYDIGDIDLISNIKKANKTADRKAQYDLVLKGVNMLPQNTQDWLSKISYRHLSRVFQDEIARGGKSSIHSYSPFPAEAYGIEFGQGEDGKY